MKRQWLLRTKTYIWLSLILAACILCVIRIEKVNRAPWIEKYAASIVLYDESMEVALPSEWYYYSGHEALSGYYMRVLQTELVSMDTFLAEHDITLEELNELSPFGPDPHFSDYGYIYIITAEFGNRDFANNADYHIELDNFLLVGADYWIAPSTEQINRLPSFNEELGGSSAFGIASDHEVMFQIPYLIDTRSESSLSIDYLLSSSPKLLVGYYPDEIYIELPAPVLLS